MAVSCDKGVTPDDPVTDPVDPTDPTDPTEVVVYSTSGTVQKGPFIKGTTITIYELDDAFARTSAVHTTETIDELGNYEIDSLTSKYIEVIAKGYYYNEVTGAVSTTEIELCSISEVSSSSCVNVNILTSLASEKIKTLVQSGTSTYEEAVVVAETEVLAVFNISSDDTDVSFDAMDFSQSGESNAVLLAVSAILQSGVSEEDLSAVITQVSSEIAESGEVVDDAVKQTIKDSAASVDVDSVKDNLESYYTSQDAEVEVPEINDVVTAINHQLKDLVDYEL